MTLAVSSDRAIGSLAADRLMSALNASCAIRCTPRSVRKLSVPNAQSKPPKYRIRSRQHPHTVQRIAVALKELLRRRVRTQPSHMLDRLPLYLHRSNRSVISTCAADATAAPRTKLTSGLGLLRNWTSYNSHCKGKFERTVLTQQQRQQQQTTPVRTSASAMAAVLALRRMTTAAASSAPTTGEQLQIARTHCYELVRCVHLWAACCLRMD